MASGELPCFAGLTIDVRDSTGQKVQTRNDSKFQFLCTGHGWTQRYPQGKVVPVLGLTLRQSWQLPDRPGDYIVTALWDANWDPQSIDPPADDMTTTTDFKEAMEHVVVRSAIVSFHIEGPPEPLLFRINAGSRIKCCS